MKSFPSLKRHHQDERNQSFFSILASPLWNILHVSYVNIHNNSNTTLFYCYFASAVVTTEFSQLTASSSDHSSLECSSTSSCGGGLAWYIQATSAVLTICILHHVYSVHLFYCTFVSSFKSKHLLSLLLITVAKIPPVAYYPSKDVATYLSRSRPNRNTNPNRHSNRQCNTRGNFVGFNFYHITIVNKFELLWTNFSVGIHMAFLYH